MSSKWERQDDQALWNDQRDHWSHQMAVLSLRHFLHEAWRRSVHRSQLLFRSEESRYVDQVGRSLDLRGEHDEH